MSRMIRAMDKQRAVGVDLPGQRVAVVPVRAPAKRALSIMAALEWAFAVERVSIEFDEFAEPRGCDTVWRLMQRGMVGCKVDGGGTSARHDDAEVIASHLAQLPVGSGGMGMAVQIASYARAGAKPDWMRDAAPRCVPTATRLTKHGMFACTEVVSKVETLHRGRKHLHEVLVCPVTYRPSAAQIGAARRHYLDWWGALLELRHQVMVTGLRTIAITDAMPPMTPWIKVVDSENVNL